MTLHYTNFQEDKLFNVIHVRANIALSLQKTLCVSVNAPNDKLCMTGTDGHVYTIIKWYKQKDKEIVYWRD